MVNKEEGSIIPAKGSGKGATPIPKERAWRRFSMIFNLHKCKAQTSVNETKQKDEFMFNERITAKFALTSKKTTIYLQRLELKSGPHRHSSLSIARQLHRRVLDICSLQI